jgi:hypothetical protein
MLERARLLQSPRWRLGMVAVGGAAAQPVVFRQVVAVGVLLQCWVALRQVVTWGVLQLLRDSRVVETSGVLQCWCSWPATGLLADIILRGWVCLTLQCQCEQ